MTDENKFFVRLVLFVGILAGAMVGWWFLLAYFVLWVAVAIYERHPGD